VAPIGDLTFVLSQFGDTLLVAIADAAFQTDTAAPIWLTFDQRPLHLFDAETERSLERDETTSRAASRRGAVPACISGA
jgi:hypothetical protein